MGKGGGSAGSAQAIEPIKSAEEAMSEASHATSRAQELRRGLSSTFSRKGVGGVSAGSNATAGAAHKLGA